MLLLTGNTLRVDSVKEALKRMRARREKFTMHQRTNRAQEKHSIVKLMALSIVDFLAEGMRGGHDFAHREDAAKDNGVNNLQVSTSPPVIAAAMGNQQIRAQVRVFYKPANAEALAQGKTHCVDREARISHWLINLWPCSTSRSN